MKQNIKIRILIAVLAIVAMSSARADTEGDRMAGAVSNYVAGVMKGLQGVADQQPTVDTFRTQMKPFVEATPGVFGASLIDTNFVIRQVYYRRDFLAVGFDLKRVSELDYFWKLIQKKPEPQLSEPGHGSLIQPRLVAMRYPIMVNGRFKGIVSVMIHTDDFLKAVGLDNCSAFKIICLGKLAEEKGELAAKYHESKLSLPSTEWVIQFQK
ncbi:MAG: hypothetical protein WCI95_07780 [bacterium]